MWLPSNRQARFGCEANVVMCKSRPGSRLRPQPSGVHSGHPTAWTGTQAMGGRKLARPKRPCASAWWGRGANSRTCAFDRRYGVETADSVRLEQLDLPTADTAEAQAYAPVAEAVFREMVRSVPIDYANSSFIDVGSGKGKALMPAASMPFKRVVGVEYVRSLHGIAEGNLSKFIAAKRIERPAELVCVDAETFEWPSGPLIVFLYNPFDCTKMRKVLGRLLEAMDREPRDVLLLYRNPVCHATIRDTARFQLRRENRHYHLYAGR